MRILWGVIDMKMIIAFFLVIGSVTTLFADETSDSSTIEKIHPLIGFSLPELLHVGVRYQANDMHIGVNIGSFPADNESIITYSVDMLWHLFGQRNALGNKPWYGKLGYTVMREESEFEINTWSYIHTRFGHEFALSNSLALLIDAGLMFQIQHDEIEKKPQNSWLDFDFEFPVLPSIGITTAYTF
jgi:hypothetical protein